MTEEFKKEFKPTLRQRIKIQLDLLSWWIEYTIIHPLPPCDPYPRYDDGLGPGVMKSWD